MVQAYNNLIYNGYRVVLYVNCRQLQVKEELMTPTGGVMHLPVLFQLIWLGNCILLPRACHFV